MTIEECTDAIDDLYGFTKTPLMPFLRTITVSYLKQRMKDGTL